MKKLLILFVMLTASTALSLAQNANRSGFFLEAGAGATVGSTPRVSYTLTNNDFTFKCASGLSVDFGLGYRLRTSSHWAYEFKANAQSVTSYLKDSFVARALPVGFRYTSVEIWRNFSLYCHFNIGGALAAGRGKIDPWSDLKPDAHYVPVEGFDDDLGFGAACSLGLGINLTTHFYMEYCWDSQAIFGAYGKDGKGTYHWGMSGLVIGYRF